MAAVTLLAIFSWSMLSSGLLGAKGMTVMYADVPGISLSTATKQPIQDALMDLIGGLKPSVTYVAGFSVSTHVDKGPIRVNLYFYPPDLCGSNVSPVVSSASGDTLQTGFKPLVQELVPLMDKLYGAGYVVSGQFQVGYVSPSEMDLVTKSNGCTTLVQNTSQKTSTGDCYGYKNILLGNSAFNYLRAGCTLESANKKNALKMQEDCQLDLIDTTVNNTLWSANDRKITPQKGCHLRVQEDWNLVVYNATGYAQWSTATYIPFDHYMGTAWLKVGSYGGLSYCLSMSEGQLMGGVQEIWSRGTPLSDSCTSSVGHSPPVASSSKNDSTPKSISLKTFIPISLSFAVLFLCLLCIVLWQRKWLPLGKDRKDAGRSEWLPADIKVTEYTFKALEVATKGFHEDNKLGEGGFGTVYKGILPAVGAVAIKRLNSSNLSEQEQKDFVNEVLTISSLQHKNLIKLLGFCCEGEQRLLVYEYMENNSLSQALLGSKLHLPWATRYEICLGVARGISYLHEDSRTRIIHRDIKASNVLLDKNLNPRLADFGLARFLKEDTSSISTRVAGTIGYLAPEYALRGQLSEKADVYSFGILVLEIVSGRHNMDFALPPDQSFLLEWAWQLYEEGRWLEIVDKKLALETGSREELYQVLMVSLACTQTLPAARPVMSRVVGMLMGDVPLKANLSKPGFLAEMKVLVQENKHSKMTPPLYSETGDMSPR